MTVTRFESEVGDILRWAATRVKEAALDMHKAVVDELKIEDLDESFITEENVSALVAGMQAFQGLLEHVRRLHSNADGIDPEGGERFRAVVAPAPEPVAPDLPAAEVQPVPMAPEVIAPESPPPAEAPVAEAPVVEAPVAEPPTVEVPVVEAPPAEAPISSEAGALTEVVTEVPADPVPMFPEPVAVSEPVQGGGGLVGGVEPQVPDAPVNEPASNDAVAAPAEPGLDPAPAESSVPVVDPQPGLDFGDGAARDESVVEVNEPEVVEVIADDQGLAVGQPVEVQPAPIPTVDIPAPEPVAEDVVAVEVPAEQTPVEEPILVEASPEPVLEQVALELPAEEVQNQDVPVTEEAPIQDLQAEEAPAAEAPAVEEVIQIDPIALETVPEAEPAPEPAPEQLAEILVEETPLSAEAPAKIEEESKQV